MKAAEAMPLLKLSAEITQISAVTSWPCWPSQANSRLLEALKTAPSINTRITRKDEAIRATAGAVAALKPKASVKPVRLRLARERLDEPALQTILAAVKKNPGNRPLILEFVLPNGRSLEMPAGEEFAVADERALSSSIPIGLFV